MQEAFYGKEVIVADREMVENVSGQCLCLSGMLSDDTCLLLTWCLVASPGANGSRTPHCLHDKLIASSMNVPCMYACGSAGI